MIEHEKTFLLKTIPFNLENYPSKEIKDHYFPILSEHPKLRVRKNGKNYEMTKKTLINENDCSIQKEQTIQLSKSEYQTLVDLPNKSIHKRRYYVPYQWLTLEIDVFIWQLDGLILMDVEFPDSKTMESFPIPDFCLADITQNSFFAWGMLCGKTFSSLSSLLKQYNWEV